jgi:hypothetical protein
MGIDFEYGQVTAGIVCLDDLRGLGTGAPNFLDIKALRRRWPLLGGGLGTEREVERTMAAARDHKTSKAPIKWRGPFLAPW